LAESVSPTDKEKLSFREFGNLDSAFAWAQYIGASGRIALLIEGDDGTHLTKHEIASALRHREGERVSSLDTKGGGRRDGMAAPVSAVRH